MNVLKSTLLCICLVILTFNSDALSRTSSELQREAGPSQTAVNNAYCNTFHSIGKIALGVSNDGTFGSQLAVSGSASDCFTGAQLPSCEYPKESGATYLFGGALWVGAILGQDTLVSTGADGWAISGNEFHPEEFGLGDMIFRSNIDPARPEFDGAISQEDYIGVFYDTCTTCNGVTQDPIDNRDHIPLNIEVTQRTFAWSFSYAEDFVLFDYGIKNIGRDRLRRVYMGFYVDADIHNISDAGGQGAQDDLCGFSQWQPASYLPAACDPDSDQVNIAWTVDNDGDPDEAIPVPDVTAMRIVRTPSDDLEVSFNWWISNGTATLDFGPQKFISQRDLGTGGTGTPEGDRNKFHVLSNQEFDYQQATADTIDPLSDEWLPPPKDRTPIWATGLDTRYLLSFGPFDIEPGQTLPVSLAYVAGENFHATPGNFSNLPDDPAAWFEGVSFEDLATNATWADWIYDNPGVDSDSDGYAGTFTVCNLLDNSTLTITPSIPPDSFPDADTFIIAMDTAFQLSDTIWRKGDGVPDFVGAGPPPAPKVIVEPSVGQIRVVWDGSRSENTRDVFSREFDFEGYRVWIGRDARRSSFSVIQSYDIEDFNKYVWSSERGIWELLESPLLLSVLEAAYSFGDSAWTPTNFPRSSPFTHPTFSDSVFYFEPQDFNQSVLANFANPTTEIKKVYEGALQPPLLDRDSLAVLFPNGGDSIFIDENGFFRFYTYEYTITDLLPTVPYWVNVTTFDFGSPTSGLAALETNPTNASKVTFPLEFVANVETKGLDVFVYPNPYRADADYRDRGFEGRGFEEFDDDRVRRINFGNLPPECTISIFSLDGDLVREIIHDIDPSDPLASHDTWDLITRNTQTAVSGLYYWTVEEPDGKTQIGKLVIIK